MMQPQIWNTPEYKLASQEMQQWAFNHPSLQSSIYEIVREEGINIENFTVKVKLNTGDFYNALIRVDDRGNIYPSDKYKSVYTSFGNGDYQKIFIVKGSSLKNKNVRFFTEQDFNNNEEVKKIHEEISNAYENYMNRHITILREALAKSLLPAALKATKELPIIIDSSANPAEEILAGFKKNEFEIPEYINANDFQELIVRFRKYGYISSAYRTNCEPDGYGHEIGTSVMIDFLNKKIYSYCWSSDD